MPANVLISTHNDDATLFAAFTVRRWNPLVVVVYDSYQQHFAGFPGTDWESRRIEDIRAMQILAPGAPVQFLGLDDRVVDVDAIRGALGGLARHFTGSGRIWIPAFEEGGQRHHNAVSLVATEIFRASGLEVTQYTSYTERGRTIGNFRVPFERDWVRQKLLALACYRSQINHPDCAPHFLGPLDEYYT